MSGSSELDYVSWPVSQLVQLPHPQKAHTGPVLCLHHYFLLLQWGLLPLVWSALP